MSEKTAGYTVTPHLLGKPGGPGLFHMGLKLPNYIENVASGIAKAGGLDKSRAIATAIAACKRWAAGGGKVSPEVRTAAAQAIAEWERLKAEARATPNKGGRSTKAAHSPADALSLASAFNPTQHPRAAAGGATGGQFVPLGQANSASSAAAQADPASQRGYRTAMTMKTADRNKYIKGLSDGDLEKLSRIAYSSTTSDPHIVALRVAVAKELAHRGIDVRGFGAHGTDLKIAKPKKPGTKAKAPKPPKPGAKPKAPAPVPGSTHLAQEPSVNRLALAGPAATTTPLADSQSGSSVTVNDTSKAAPTGSGDTSTKLDAASRRKAAKSGAALKDGSFPIFCPADVGNAVAAHGRANEKKQPMVKAHILKRAAAVGGMSKVPADWKK